MSETFSEDRVQQLRRIGAALYGRQWQSALAEDLRINDRTMRRWVSGDWSIPAAAWPQLLDLLAERAVKLADLVVELQDFIPRGEFAMPGIRRAQK